MKAKQPIAILQAGSTFEQLQTTHGDFDQWIATKLAGAPYTSIAVNNGESLPDTGSISGAIITGSHAMVTDRETWSEQLAQWIRQAHQQNLPLLGICYGHQLIAHALGGKVDYRDTGIEIGTHQVQLSSAAASDDLLGIMPARFDAHLVHSQSVIELPAGATVLAANAAEPHQSFRVGNSTWGVQFHPEFDATVMRFYLSELQKDFTDSVRDTPETPKLLWRFAEITALHNSDKR
jgi:GMP synthase (glutamine-hydrolysing)